MRDKQFTNIISKTMKKYTLLLISLFFVTAAIQAQTVRTDIDITGLGQFSFGLTPEEIKKPMLEHMTSKTEISNSIEEDGSIFLTNVTYNGTPFDACTLEFNKDGLYCIYFSKDFEQGDNSMIEVLLDLKRIFDKKYGEQTESPEFNENNMMGYYWFDKYNSCMLVAIRLGKKGEDHSLVISALQKEKPVQKPASGITLPGTLTSVPITGLGEFALGMSPDEMNTVLEQSKTATTKISGILDGESSMIATNLKSMGYVFDYCSFTFIDNELSSIRLQMYFDKKNTDPKEFEELLTMIEGDYGKRTRNERSSYMWTNEDQRIIMFSKELEKKRTEISISVKKNILDIRNLEVYK